jgi:phosphohistidine phosphatase
VTGPARGTDETTRRLTLLRHAKSDWPDVPDHDRPLAKRGRKDAPRIGRWLRTHGYVPDIVICSTALRTRQTWDLVAPELNGSARVQFEPRAYAASALTLLYLCQELPAPCQAALLIGHNPGIEELAASLGGAPEPAGLRFPTAAVAVFGFTGAWSTLEPGRANLLDYTIPADLLRTRERRAKRPAGLLPRRGDHGDQGQLPGGQRGVRVGRGAFLLCWMGRGLAPAQRSAPRGGRDLSPIPG